MRVAVIGGGGTLGKHVVAELRGRGHDVRAPSRRSTEHPIDLTTGAGLAPALAGCEAVVDSSNDASKRAASILVDGSKRLLEAAKEAGVRHHVCVSIVGCDAVPTRYYGVKVEQERVTREGPVPWSIVRATQFHDLLLYAFHALGKWGVLPLPRAALQPVAPVEVAHAIADVVEGAPLGRIVNVAGPAVADVREFARAWKAHTRRATWLLPVPLPGALGRALRAGGLTHASPDVRGTITFAEALHG